MPLAMFSRIIPILLLLVATFNVYKVHLAGENNAMVLTFEMRRKKTLDESHNKEFFLQKSIFRLARMTENTTIE